MTDEPEYRGIAQIDVGTVEEKGRVSDSSGLSEQERLELEFLRYFYANVEGALGPASDDIYHWLGEEWIKTGNQLPEDYKPEEYDED